MKYSIAPIVALIASTEGSSLRGVKRATEARVLKGKGKKNSEGSKSSGSSTMTNSYWQGLPSGTDLTQATLGEITITSKNVQTTTSSGNSQGPTTDGRDPGNAGENGIAESVNLGDAEITYIGVKRPDGAVSYEQGKPNPPEGTSYEDNSLIPCKGEGCTDNSSD